MHTKDFSTHDSSHGQTVEAVRKRLPELDVVPTFALVIESIDPVDACTLVVPTKEEEVLRVLDLVRQQQTDGLERLFAPVDIVTQEKIVGMTWELSIFKESQEVKVLTVDVTYGTERWTMSVSYQEVH